MGFVKCSSLKFVAVADAYAPSTALNVAGMRRAELVATRKGKYSPRRLVPRQTHHWRLLFACNRLPWQVRPPAGQVGVPNPTGFFRLPGPARISASPLLLTGRYSPSLEW